MIKSVSPVKTITAINFVHLYVLLFNIKNRQDTSYLSVWIKDLNFEQQLFQVFYFKSSHLCGI